jgi:hypothetical protein
MAAGLSFNGGSVAIGKPHALFPFHPATGVNITPGRAQYAVAADGRFLVNAPVAATETTPIHIVLNWAEALNK